MGVLSWLLIGAIAGWLVSVVVQGDPRLGSIAHVILGSVGALVGGFVGGVLTGSDPNRIDVVPLVLAAGGAVVLVVVWERFLGRPAGRSTR